MTQSDTLQKQKTYTYQDYAQLPEGAPYELIHGNMVQEPAPTPYHQRISRKMLVQMSNFIESQDSSLGEIFDAPIDVFFEETETYQPDLIFISENRQHIIKPDKVEGAPDIVFEILSPSTAYYDLRHKKDIYAKHGVKEYWIIDPMEQSIEVYNLANGQFTLKSYQKKKGKLTSSVLNGFAVELEEIF